MLGVFTACNIIGIVVGIIALMIYLMEEDYCDFEIEDTLNHVDDFLKFGIAPQVLAYDFLEDKLRLSGIIICEIVVTLFFITFNIIVFILLFVAKLFQLLWRLFVKIFGKKEEEEEAE